MLASMMRRLCIVVVSAHSGDIDPSPAVPTGQFSFDTRFLSKWQLSIDGERLNALTVDRWCRSGSWGSPADEQLGEPGRSLDDHRNA